MKNLCAQLRTTMFSLKADLHEVKFDISTANIFSNCFCRGSPSSLSALMDMPHQVRIVELLVMNTNVSTLVLMCK